jgi:hypothetical protein
MARNSKSVLAVVVASFLVAVALVAVTNIHMQSATSNMFHVQSVTMLEEVSAEVSGKKLKHPGDAQLAARMQQMINAINGDYNSMMSYGSKVGYVAPATESIAAQARDGSLYKSPDIPDPPKFNIDPKGFVLGSASSHPAAAAPAAVPVADHAAALSVPAVEAAHAPVHHAVLSSAPATGASNSVSAKEATLEAELRKLKEQDLEAQLQKLQGSAPAAAPAPVSVHAAIDSADAPVKSAVHSDASYLLSHEAHADVPRVVAPSDSTPDILSHPLQHAAATGDALGSASGPYVRNGIKYFTLQPCFFDNVVTYIFAFRYKNYNAYLLAKKMQALTAQISGDFDSMMSYGSKVGYVPPAGQESISAQVKDGSMFKSPNVPDPPAFKPVLDSNGIANLAATAAVVTPAEAQSIKARLKVPSVPGLPSLPVLPGQGTPADFIQHHLRSVADSATSDKADRAAAPSKGESEWQKKFGFLAKDEAAAAKDDD